MRKLVDQPVHDSFLYPIRMDKEIYLLLRYIAFQDEVEEVINEHDNLEYTLHVRKQAKYQSIF